jgi:prepilin-type N-terminal cleavage/methylation domain-containing protein
LNFHNRRGFSLIEVIITVTIIAFVSAMALPKLNNHNNDIRMVVRKIAVISHMLSQRARLQNATYRLVINMSENPEAKKPIHEFWVEMAHGQILNNYDPKNPPKLATADDKKNNDKDKEVSPFTPAGQILKKPFELPGDLLFESVELASLKEPVKSGLVYIYYYASGFTDEAAIHLKYGEKIKWTLAVEALTGKVDIINEFRALEDLRSK